MALRWSWLLAVCLVDLFSWLGHAIAIRCSSGADNCPEEPHTGDIQFTHNSYIVIVILRCCTHSYYSFCRQDNKSRSDCCGLQVLAEIELTANQMTTLSKQAANRLIEPAAAHIQATRNVFTSRLWSCVVAGSSSDG